MAKPFDPRKVLTQLSKPLLRQFFAPHPTLAALSWDDIPEGQTKAIYEAMVALPTAPRRDLHVTLQDIDELAMPAGLVFLTEQIQARRPQRLDEFAAVPGHADKALWMHLNVPDGFSEAAIFARANALSTGRFWEKRNGLPLLTLVVDEALKNTLGQTLSDYYSKAQRRGFQHHVVHYSRPNAAEFFFVYMDDFPDYQPAFDDAGVFKRRPGQGAFDNILAYNPTDGTLELFAHGGAKVHDELQKRFCLAVLGAKMEPTRPTRPVYRLDQLKDPAFMFVTDPGDAVAEVRIRALRVEPVDAPRRSFHIKADPKGLSDDIHRAIDLYVSAMNLPRAKMHITMATLQLTLMSDGQAKPRTMTFDLSHPSSCNLKSKPDEMRIVGERCLKLSGITP